MAESHDELMPDESITDHHGDALSLSVAKQINDNIQDAQSLRECRLTTAKVLAVVAGIFYITLLSVIGMLVSDDGIIRCAVEAPNVCITVLLILAIVPTLITIQIARAIFGKHHHGDTPYTPLQTLVHLVKEMNG